MMNKQTPLDQLIWFLTTTALLLVSLLTHSQTTHLTNLSPIELSITHDKTTHLLFDSAISYVDLGNKQLVASMVKDAPNVLRVKAAGAFTDLHTNFSVICQNGEFYSFIATYQSTPTTLTYEIDPSDKKQKQQHAILNEKLSRESMQSIEQNMKLVAFTWEKPWYTKLYKKQGKKASIVSIYSYKGHYYLNISLQNKVGAPFEIEQIQLNLVQRKSRRNTARQIKNIPIASLHKPITPLHGFSTMDNVLLVKGLTLSAKEKLLLEFIDSNQRHIILPIKAKHLNKAREIKQ